MANILLPEYVTEYQLEDFRQVAPSELIVGEHYLVGRYLKHISRIWIYGWMCNQEVPYWKRGLKVRLLGVIHPDHSRSSNKEPLLMEVYVDDVLSGQYRLYVPKVVTPVRSRVVTQLNAE